MTSPPSEVGRKVRRPPMKMSVTHRRMAILYSCAVLAVVLPGGGRAEQQTARASDGDWPMYRHDLRRYRLLAAGADRHQNVADADAGLDLRSARRCGAAAQPAGRGGAQFPGHADRRQRRDVSARRESRRGARAGDRQGNLAASRHRRRAVAARRRVLARRRQPSAAHHLHRRPPPDRAQRQDRRADAGFGNDGEVDMVVPYNSVPLVYQERRRRRRQHAAGDDRRHRQPAGVRCAHRRQAVGIQLGAAARRGRSRHLGRRQLEGPPRRQRVAVLLHARRAARAALPAAGVADRRRVRRRPQGREPVRQLGRRRRCRRPASTTGTSRPSITISGTPIRRRRRDCSTSCGTDARFRRWR